MDPLWTLTHLWRGPRVRQPLVLPIPLRSWDPTARLDPACPAKGLPRPPRKYLEPLGSNGPCHGIPSPPCAAKLPPFLSTPLPHPVLSMCFQGPMVPRKTLPGQSPKPLGRSQFPQTEDICPCISLAKNKLSSGMCKAGICSPHHQHTPNCQGLLLSQLCENWGAMEQMRGKCVSMHT